MAEKNLIDPSASADLTPTSDYISHHLTNLTYGWCEKTQSWGFANHQQSLFSESSCKVGEMGFWAFHLDTIFMSRNRGISFIPGSIDIVRTNRNSYSDSGKPKNFNPIKGFGVSDHLPMVAKFKVIN